MFICLVAKSRKYDGEPTSEFLFPFSPAHTAPCASERFCYAERWGERNKQQSIALKQCAGLALGPKGWTPLL